MPQITPLFTIGNQILINFFDQSDATNYTSHLIEDKHNNCDYIITMQKVNGETPLLQLQEEKEKVAKLEHALAQALILAEQGNTTFGSKRSDIAARIREAL